MSKKAKNLIKLAAVIVIISVVAVVILHLTDDDSACPALHSQSNRFEILFTGPEIHGKNLSLLIDGQEQLGDATVVALFPNKYYFSCKLKCERETLDERGGVALCIDDGLEYQFTVRDSEAIIIE